MRLSGNNEGDNKTSILAVDDNCFNIMAYKNSFSFLKMEVDAALDGISALEMIKEKYRQTGQCYKLILMDFSMPELTGPETTTKILGYLASCMPKLHRPHICCITNFTHKKFREEALEAGMDDF